MSEALTAVLFAGGQSRRMGRDKTEIVIEGKPLWRRQLDLLAALAPHELLVSGPERPAWEGVRFLADVMPGAGPFGGLVAALRHSPTDRVLALAIDLPRMSAGFLERLVKRSRDGCGAIPVRDGFYEPLAAVYSKAALALAEEALGSRRYAMHDFAESAVAAHLLIPFVVEGEEAECLFNMNHPEDAAGLAPGQL